MNFPLRRMSWSSILAFCAAVVLMSVAFAQPASLATVSIKANSIAFEPSVPHTLAITVVGPNDLRIEQALDPDGTVLDSTGNLPDGYYKYEITIVSLSGNRGAIKTATKTAQQLANDASGRPVGAAAALGAAASSKQGNTRQSGGFRILNGEILDPSARE